MLYHIWDSILTEEAGICKVNLLLNRTTPFLDIESYLPAGGKVVIKIKKTPNIMVRMPAWCEARDMSVTVSGERRMATVAGRYILVDQLKPGDRVVVTFPMTEQVLTRLIGDLPFTLRLRGSQVVDIDPRGTGIPFFTHIPTGELVEKERFLPERDKLI